MGYLVVKELAKKRGISFKKESHFEGEMATTKENDETIHFFLPTTYMNLSGVAVRKVVDFYKLPFKSENSLLVVVDDVFHDFGTICLRRKGSAGGHNGLKSIEGSLQSPLYPRLKMGIGPKEEEIALEEYVLGTFTADEKPKLPLFIEKGANVVECWLENGIDQAMQMAKKGVKHP